MPTSTTLGRRPRPSAAATARIVVFVEDLEQRQLLARTLGIDVSHYQTVSSWSSVYNADRKFVWVKSSEGATYKDSKMASHMAGATAAGVIAGVYHFARPNSNSATTEANHFLNTARAYMGAGYLKPTLDIEVSSLSKTATSNWVNTFCNTVLNATGVRPVVYTGASFASTKLDSTVTQWSPWIASYNGQSPYTGGPTSYAPWSGWSFWQYTDSASVSGISGGVDGDVYASDTTALINNHVGKSSKFSVGQSVKVTASALKAWDTYASNGTYVSKPYGTTGTIQGGPVYVAGFLRWKVLYSGDTVARWSAGDYLAPNTSTMTASGGGTTTTATPTRVADAVPASSADGVEPVRTQSVWSLVSISGDPAEVV